MVWRKRGLISGKLAVTSSSFYLNDALCSTGIVIATNENFFSGKSLVFCFLFSNPLLKNKNKSKMMEFLILQLVEMHYKE